MRHSIRKVIVNDWPALASSIGVPIIWLIHFGFPYISKSHHHPSIWLPSLISCSLISLLWWRAQRIAWFFVNGASASGIVLSLKIIKDRGRIEFAFQHEGNKITTWTPIHKTKLVLSLVPGTNIDVLFDARKPTRAIIKELYSS